MTYRSEIDGLRAVAIIAAMLFHFGFALPGGFAGVDMFFVISGYLITRIIRDETLSLNRFRFGRFYLRRVRRLFPSLFFVLCGSLVCGWILFPDDLFQRSSGAGIAAVFSLSNVYFWAEAGYFDASSIVKPFLHTWSLSVEEQYYLVWPSFLVLLLTKTGQRNTAIIVGGVGLLSFAAGQFVFNGGLSMMGWHVEPGPTVFFLTPFRIFEFAIGAGLLCLDGRFTRQWLHEVFCLIGALILLASFFFLHEDMDFPSFNAFLPTIGTALIILGSKARYGYWLLKLPPVTWMGRISYTLYIVHWPLVVFYAFRKAGGLGPIDGVILFVATFVIATVIYYLVEKPLRYDEYGKTSLFGKWQKRAGLTAIILALLPAVAVQAGVLTPDRSAQRKMSGAIRTASATTDNVFCDMLVPGVAKPGLGQTVYTRSSDCRNDAGTRLLTVGNSHEPHGYRLFRNMFIEDVRSGDLAIDFASSHVQNGNECDFHKLDALPFRSSNKPCTRTAGFLNDHAGVAENYDVLVVSALRPLDVGRRYLDYASALQTAQPDIKIIVLGTLVDISPYRCFDLVLAKGENAACLNPDLVVYYNPDEEAQIREAYPALDFFYFDQRQLLCGEGGYPECDIVYQDAPIFRDYHHLIITATPKLIGLAEQEGSVARLRAYLAAG